MIDEKRYDRSVLIWSWLLPLAYLIHISEEYRGGGGYSAYMARVRGVHITPTRFLVLNGIGCGLMLLGIFLARRLKFLEWLVVCLCTVEAANGVSHTITAVVKSSYNPGVVTGLLLFIPLGAAGLYLLKKSMNRSRYLTAMVVGVAIQGVVSLLALSGGKTPAS
jgi:4-amino-4-deoxy-L-arabinose transferase-like glycosyltransferase